MVAVVAAPLVADDNDLLGRIVLYQPFDRRGHFGDIGLRVMV